MFDNDREEGKEERTATDKLARRHHGHDEHKVDEKATDDVELLKKQLEEEREKADNYLKNWQRTQADFIKYKRRTEQEKVEQVKYANTSLILKVLPVLDDFDRALASLPRQAEEMTWLEGIKLIDRKLRTILEQAGVTPIEALGHDFDPTLHEAVLFEEGADPRHGKVVEELQKGYKLQDRIIRPTLVKVGQMPPASENQGGGESFQRKDESDQA